MPARLRHRVDAVPVTAVPAREQVDPDVLLAIGATMRAREVLRFRYSDAPRHAEPHHLVARGGRWYLVAWDLDRDDWRTFRVDRIHPRTPNGPRFDEREVPGGDVTRFLEARFRGSDGSPEWPCVGRAVLAAPASEVAPYVAEGRVEPLDDGRCHVELGSWSWIGLAASLARFDAAIEDVEPAELRDACATLATRLQHAAEVH